MVSILKMRRFSCLLRLSLPPEMDEMAQSFILEIECLAAIKCRTTGLHVNIIVPYGTKVFSKSVKQASARFTDVKFAAITARNAESRFRSGNRRGRVEVRTLVTTSMRATKDTLCCQ